MFPDGPGSTKKPMSDSDDLPLEEQHDDDLPEGFRPPWSGWFGYTSKLESVEKHGITDDEYRRMLSEQDDQCAICERHPTSVGPLFIDHDHDSGQVRGLLCMSCNLGLGNFKDDPDLLVDARRYLLERGSIATREIDELKRRPAPLPPSSPRRAYSLELHYRDGNKALGAVLSEMPLGENGQTFDMYGLEWRVSERISMEPDWRTGAQAEHLVCHEVGY